MSKKFAEHSRCDDGNAGCAGQSKRIPENAGLRPVNEQPVDRADDWDKKSSRNPEERTARLPGIKILIRDHGCINMGKHENRKTRPVKDQRQTTEHFRNEASHSWISFQRLYALHRKTRVGLSLV